MVKGGLPHSFGRYEVISEQGRGSMGVVYKARDPVIGRMVAIKAIPETLGLAPEKREEYIRRLRQEAITAGRLQHPSIVTIYDVGENELGPYIAMEYLDGVTLREVIAAGKALSLAQMSEVINQVADGLDYAHRKAVIHRDIKPSNIMIVSDNKVKIMDLGIARIPMSELTKEGKLVGSPSYMSPEQLRGEQIDSRSDLFSLGVVIYQCLTLHKPFPGENINEICYRIVHEEFVPLSRYLDHIPEGLEYFMAKALAKIPADRFQTGAEMAQALAALLKKSQESKSDDTGRTETIAASLPTRDDEAFIEATSNPNLTQPSTIDNIFQDLTITARSFMLEEPKPRLSPWWWVAIILALAVGAGLLLWMRS